MRHTNLVFCLPVKEPCRPPPKPIGQDTRQCRFTTPLVGWSTPPMMLSKVDLPAPLRPTRPTLNLGGRVTFLPSKTHFPSIGSASCRERVWQYVSISGVAVS